MNTAISTYNNLSVNDTVVYILKEIKELKNYLFSKTEEEILKQTLEKKGVSEILNNNRFVIFILLTKKEADFKELEFFRKKGSNVCDFLNEKSLKSVQISNYENKQHLLALAEGIILANYQFLKYKKKKQENTLQKVQLPKELKTEAKELQNISFGTFACRDLVNEPHSFLTTAQFVKEIKRLGKESGYSVETLNKSKIEALKMGGVLAVNKGSIDPPAFSILEWKPKEAINKKPLVFVGKGIVFDTGGVNIKVAGMELMKSDMGGAATLVGLMSSVAKSKLQYHVISLIPITDNRPSQNAFVPSDVITMHNGLTVEVLNTDAEGRLILADGLSYAAKYNPELVMDVATLTGAAIRANGIYGSVSMGTAPQEVHDELIQSGYNTFEKVAQTVFWEEYGEEMQSEIADLNNLGGSYAGHITAGKFLEHFTKNDKGKENYPWIHIDIAGPSLAAKRNHYIPSGGTGVGVRLLYDFIKNRVEKK